MSSRGGTEARLVVIASSAALLFLVEPLVAQRLLPALGGSPSVWLGVSLAFQILFLLATALSAWLARGPLLRARVTLLVLAALGCIALALQFAIGPGLLHVPHLPAMPPLAEVLLATLLMAGPPFLTLGVAGPLLQRGREGAFGRYALSSAGSMVGLLIGPLLLSRFFDLDAQARLWAVAFGVFALLTPLLLPAVEASAPSVASGTEPRGTWVALAALGAALQLAVTHHLTENVAPVPLLWVVPLALYLGSYVVAFAAPRWASPERAGPIFATGLLGTMEVMGGHSASLELQVLALGLLLWGGCLLCHGTLQRLRPPGEELPRFALAVQLGGVLGSAAVSGLAPLIFRGTTEFQLCLALLIALLARQPSSLAVRVPLLLAAAIDLGLRLSDQLTKTSLSQHQSALLCVAAVVLVAVALLGTRASVAALVLIAALAWDHVQDLRGSLAQRRNFFGVVRIDAWEGYAPDQARRLLMSGSIVHGVQWIDPKRETEPAVYYRRDAAIGLLLDHAFLREGGRTVGVLGLGAGTLAAYAKPADHFRFYEINPDMVWAAREQFHFLRRAEGHVDIEEGDGRRLLDEETTATFDVLVLDAFSGDAVPVHLLTTEAFEIYLRHLAPGGIIAAQVTNTYVDLEKILARVGQRFGLQVVEMKTAAQGPLDLSCRWVLLSRSANLTELLPQSERLTSDGRPPWTDARVDLLEVLR